MNVEIYQKANKKEPFTDWFNGLKDPKSQNAIKARLVRLRLGNRGDWKSVQGTDGAIFELRLMIGPGYRLYCAQEGETIIILLWGGDKSTQDRDITKAKGYWDDYKSR